MKINKVIFYLCCLLCVAMGVFIGLQFETTNIVVYGVTPKSPQDLQTVRRILYAHREPNPYGCRVAQKIEGVGEDESMRDIGARFAGTTFVGNSMQSVQGVGERDALKAVSVNFLPTSPPHVTMKVEGFDEDQAYKQAARIK